MGGDTGFVLDLLSLENCATFQQKGPESKWTFSRLGDETREGMILELIHTCVQTNN